MATQASRVETLEQRMLPVDFDPVEIGIYVKDCSKPGDGKAARLATVIHSGTRERPGREYHRGSEETEQAFRQRIDGDAL